MNKKRVRFIVNPISGVGRQKIIPTLVETHLDATQFDHEIVYTEAAKHATELARLAAEDGVDIVAIVGGDGSVNEAGTGLINTNTALSIIPTGSGNGMAHHLQLPINLEAAIKVMNNHRIQTIDTGKMNDQHFIGVAGTGFDALIAWEFSQFGKRGFFSYFKIVLREYFKYKEAEYTFSVDGESFTRKAFLVTVANSSQYGNRATIAPEAVIDDGKLRLCILRKFSLFMAPIVAMRLFNKTIHKSRYMETFHSTAFKVETKSDITHADGEPIKIVEHLEFNVLPATLKMVVPA